MASPIKQKIDGRAEWSGELESGTKREKLQHWKTFLYFLLVFVFVFGFFLFLLHDISMLKLKIMNEFCSVSSQFLFLKFFLLSHPKDINEMKCLNEWMYVLCTYLAGWIAWFGWMNENVFIFNRAAYTYKRERRERKREREREMEGEVNKNTHIQFRNKKTTNTIK